MLTLLTFTQSEVHLFHLFIVLCENEYFLIYNRQLFFHYIKLFSVLWLIYLSCVRNKYFCQYFHDHSISYDMNTIKISTWRIHTQNQLCCVDKISKLQVISSGLRESRTADLRSDVAASIKRPYEHIRASCTVKNTTNLTVTEEC